MDDVHIRITAFRWLQDQIRIHGDELPAQVLRDGLLIGDERVPLMGPSGIWKPKVLANLPLSITTTWNNPYQDRVGVDDVFIYSYRSGEHIQNEYLRRAAQQRTPMIYFHAVAKARYNALFPVFIVHNDERAREIRVQVGDVLQAFAYQAAPVQPFLSGVAEGSPDPVRSYLTVQAKVRLHQRVFRERVLTAYSRRCACCGFRHEELLDAAHIIPDAHELGKPVVPNGLSLCTLHHRAFDHALIGVTPDCQITVRPSLLDEQDGPTLKGIQGLNGQRLLLPHAVADHPDRDALDHRFQQFLSACG
jgi:putative restriction endonuclease